MALASGLTVVRRPLALGILGLLATLSGHAAAGGAWLPGNGQTAVEQRVAIALGPSRTTLWTSVRFDGGAGPVGVVVPVPPLASLDLSSDAWMEALEVATAPRVSPPDGISPYCPGEQGPPDPVHVAGDVTHTATLAPAEIIVLNDAGAVALWAAQSGLALAPEVASALDAQQGKRFLAARFVAPGGPGLTRTLRVVLPAAEPVLPLALTRGGTDDVRVTAWLIGPGRAALPGTTAATVLGADLAWSAGTLESDYEDARLAALASAGADGAVLECSSHEALVENLPAGGSATIDGVITTYFERAVAYGDGAGDPAACVSLAAAALASSAAVSTSCPRADQGVVDGVDTCAEAPQPGETDPTRLRCGQGADDLAVGLSGLSPAGAWLTRYTLRVPASQLGMDRALGFAAGATVHPELEAGGVSLSECDSGTGTGTGTSSSSSSTGTSSTGTNSTGSGPIFTVTSGGPTGGTGGTIYYDDSQTVGYVGCDCSGTADTADTYYDDGSDDSCSGGSSDSYSDGDDSCSGDSSDSYYDDSGDDSCSGDSSDSSYDDSGDDCSGDSSDSYYDDSGDDCSGDSGSSGGDECSGDSSGSSSDSCSTGTSDGGGDTSCDAGSSEDCSIAASDRSGLRKRRGPRLSPLALGLLMVLAPIRRLMRPRRRGRR